MYICPTPEAVGEGQGSWPPREKSSPWVAARAGRLSVIHMHTLFEWSMVVVDYLLVTLNVCCRT